MREPALADFVERLMREDIAPTLDALRGFDPNAYIDAILQRFRNPHIRHLLSQIAWDGSQKLPVRILGTIADAIAAGRPINRLCLPVAAWMHFVRRQARNGVALVDPLDETLREVGRSTAGNAQDDVRAFLTLDAVFASSSANQPFVERLTDAYAALGDATPDVVAHALSNFTETRA
jgi:fructuronate reductase